MDIYIYEPDFNKILLIEYAESIIFTKSLNDIGNFEIKIPLIDIQTLNQIQIGFFVKAMYNDSDFFIIREIEKTFSSTDGNYIYLRGEELKALLKYRIVIGQKNLNSTVENNCTELVNFINSNYPFFYPIDVEANAHNETYQLQFDFENFYTALKTITETANFYFDLQYDESINKFKLLVFNKADYTETVFSKSFNNILSFNEKKDDYDNCNIAVVVGEGSGTSKRYQIVGYVSAGSNDIYCKVDATNISSNNGVITQQEYNNFLINQGIAYKNSNYLKTTYEVQVDTRLYKYPTDFAIGAVVTVINPINNNLLYGLVEEVTQKWDINGYVCDVKLEIVNI